MGMGIGGMGMEWRVMLHFIPSRALTISTADPSTEIVPDPLSLSYPAPSTRRHTEGIVNVPTFQRNGKNSQFIRKPNVKSSRSTRKRPKRNGSTGSNHSESGQSQESGEILAEEKETQEEEVANKVRVQLAAVA